MSGDYIKLEPPRASLGQLQLSNKLKMVRVEQDVLGVVESLKRIDPGLEMMFEEDQGIFVLYHRGLTPQGELKESIVGAYKELDQRIINLIERIDKTGRGRADLARDLERLEAEKQREADRQRYETVGPIAEKLRHAMRADLGLNGDTAHMSSRIGRRRKR